MIETTSANGKLYTSLTQLHEWEKNPRAITEKSLERLKVQITRLGQFKPLLINSEGAIIAGNMRSRALKQLNQTKAWVEILPENTPEEKLFEYALADNDHTGQYVTDQLSQLLDQYKNQVPLQHYAAPIALPRPVLDLLPKPPTFEDNFNPDEITEAEVQSGERWQLGDHTLYCGDALQNDSYKAVIPNGPANMTLTDPPYGVNYADKNKFLNEYDNGNRIQKPIENDEMNWQDWENFCTTLAQRLSENTQTHLYSFHSPSNYGRRYAQALDEHFHQSAIIIWNKEFMILGRGDYQGQYEPIYYGWNKESKGETPRKRPPRNATDVWNYPKTSSSRLHPTMKPITLLARAITTSTNEGDTILDPFLGSGSTLIACQQTGRKCAAIEKDPLYCTITIKRWEALVGKKAVKISKNEIQAG